MNNPAILMQEEKDLIREILKEMTRRDKIYFKAILDSLITKGTAILKAESARLGQNIDTPKLRSITEQTVRINILSVWALCMLEQKDGRKTPDKVKEPTSKLRRYSDFLEKSGHL